MKRVATFLVSAFLTACAFASSRTPDAPTDQVTATQSVPPSETSTAVETVTATHTVAPTSTPQGWATLQALYTAIPGPMPEPTRSGGLAEPSSFQFYPSDGETVAELQAGVIKLMTILAAKTGPDLPDGMEGEIRDLILPAHSLESNPLMGSPCDVDDTVAFFQPDLSPSFGLPYSLWLEAVDTSTIIWNGIGDPSIQHPVVIVTYDGRRDIVYAEIGANLPNARLMAYQYPTDTTEPTDHEVRGAVYFLLVDGQWRIALTSIGCQYRIQ